MTLSATGEVAVLIPVLNEKEAIGECLDRILRQTYADIDIVVIDGGSIDGTGDLVKQRASSDRRVRVIQNPRRIQAAGLTAALDAVPDARVVIRLDARSFVEVDYVERCVAVLDETGAAEVGGRMVARSTGSRIARGIALANGARWGAGPAAFHHGGTSGPADTVYLGAFDVGWLRKVGGWADDLPVNEDWELSYRIRRAGGTVWFDPSLQVAYRPRNNLASLARQYFRYGRGKATVVRRHPTCLLPRQVLPALLVPTGLAALLRAPAVLGRSARLALSLHIAGVAVGASGLKVPAVDRCAAAIAAVVMHWSWASGAWFGTFAPYGSRSAR